jgi:predicted DCC family thiol-disulfide oxidoreductase YuxK
MELKVVFYDGDCGLCNKSVQLILKREKNHDLKFCALQSEVAQAFFLSKGEELPDMSTLVFYSEGVFYKRSTAILKIASFLKFPTSLVRVLWILPKFLRDFGYRIVAKRRTKMFKSQCFLPSSVQRVRFLTEKW